MKKRGNMVMSYNYQCVEQVLCDDVIVKYTAYGVKNTANNNVISDVGSNIDIVSAIVNKLNKYQVFPVHLREIIDDLISD